MAKATFGNLSSQFQDFDTVAQLASQTRSLRYQDYHYGRLAQLTPQHELLSSDQTSFADLNQTATNLGALDQYIKSGSKREYCQELPDWIRDYLIKQPLGLNQPPQLAPVLNQGQIIKLQYYLDPAVENIIQSGQAGSVLSLFLSDELADHPQLATFGSGVVKLLKVIILDSIHPEDDPTQSMINNCRTIADLTRVTDQLAGYFLDRNDFGHVINHDLTSLYYKRSRGYSPRSDLELAICRLFDLWHGLDPTQLETLLGDCRNGSLGPKAALPQSLDQQVIQFLLDRANGTAKLPTLDFSLESLIDRSQQPGVDRSVGVIMQHILMILPQCHDCALYKELVAIANRLILDPVGLSYFLSQHDLYLGQTGSLSKLTSTVSALNKLSAAERQQLQLYLKPELQALLHSPQGRQIGEDFAANRIRPDQNSTLPPGSLDLLRFLVAETQLSGTTDIKENFLQPVRPDLVEVYQRWRYNKILPGDNYLLPYFQLYDNMDYDTIKASYDQFKAGDDNDGRDGLEADFSIFYVIAKPWLVLVEPQYYDPVRHNVLTKLVDGIIRPSLADRICRVLPHNSATATYRIWTKLVEDLDTEAARAELTELLSEVVVESSSQLDTSGYPDLIKSQQFEQHYDQFVMQPDNSKAAQLVKELAELKRLVLTQPLSRLADYCELNTALDQITTVYVSATKARL